MKNDEQAILHHIHPHITSALDVTERRPIGMQHFSYITSALDVTERRPIGMQYVSPQHLT